MTAAWVSEEEDVMCQSFHRGPEFVVNALPKSGNPLYKFPNHFLLARKGRGFKFLSVCRVATMGPRSSCSALVKSWPPTSLLTSKCVCVDGNLHQRIWLSHRNGGKINTWGKKSGKWTFSLGNRYLKTQGNGKWEGCVVNTSHVVSNRIGNN